MTAPPDVLKFLPFQIFLFYALCVDDKQTSSLFITKGSKQNADQLLFTYRDSVSKRLVVAQTP